MIDERFMQLAIEKAMEGIEKGQAPFGAVIARGDEVVSCRHNEVWQKNDPTAHAEILAISETCQKLGAIDLSDCTIYSTCEPCPMCFAAIHWARIPHIVYGARIDDVRDLGFRELPISNRRLNHLAQSNIKITWDFMREQNLEILHKWTSREDARQY